MSATHDLHPTSTASSSLYLAFELGWTSWNLAFTTAIAQKPRLRTIPARDLDAATRSGRFSAYAGQHRNQYRSVRQPCQASLPDPGGRATIRAVADFAL